MNLFRMLGICTLLAGTFLLGISRCAEQTPCPNDPSEFTETQHFLAPIRGIEVNQPVTVYLKSGIKQSVTIQAQSSSQKLLTPKVESGILRFPQQGCPSMGLVNVFVTLAEPIVSLVVAGEAEVYSEESLDVHDELKLHVLDHGELNLDLDAQQVESVLSGEGILNLIGQAEEHILTLLENATFNGYDFESKAYWAKLFGAGDAFIQLEGGTLEVEISDSGSVYYAGKPTQIQQQITGSGKLIQAD
ncbi:GIN domain-containing protein [Pontibacter sp. G13]|uniref:GIN domain-containing protein n=1 Tax=Pontibacter sp. G13 TaxID=3074898 RepID=UPI002889BFBF|nr:DUF2807 domain-containing protein [Pontibacter sp. G13]WNJ18026.1 DUF2807 domain-containing protein [Pontibacter sp. G13]